MSFSKLLLLLESGIVLYTTYEGFALAKFAVASGAPSQRGLSSAARLGEFPGI